MEFGAELRLKAFFRSPSASNDPSSNVLHLQWQHFRRVSRRTLYGILPASQDEPIGNCRFSQFGFRFELLSEFRHQIWISLASLNFPLPLCRFLYQNITSFAIDFTAERPTLPCPAFIIIADINFVQKRCVEYTLRPVEFIQPRRLGAADFAAEAFLLGTSTDGRRGEVVDSNAFEEETFILEGTTEGWVGAEGDRDSFVDETFIPTIQAEVDEDNNAGIEMLKRIKKRKWVMVGGGEINCGVCLEEFTEGEEVMRLECEHQYHEECILTWLEQKQTCPLCRRRI